MFWHIFSYRLRCIVHDVPTLFWSTAFPIVLATLFGLSLGNISQAEQFTRIAVAVVDNQAYQASSSFQAALASVSEGDANLFLVNLASAAEAAEWVDTGAVAGALTLNENGDLDILIKSSGIYQTIIKSFADTYLQMNSAYYTIARENPGALLELAMEGSSGGSYFQEVSLGASYPDNTVVYYFALIAMACMYGSFQGLTAVTVAQANQSTVAARSNLVPVHKLKLFGASLSAALVVHFASVLLLIAYLGLVIGVQFGDRLWYILLACAAGSMMGVAFGAMVGALLKRRENTKIAVLISVSMVCSFLAGLMFVNMKYIVQQSVPVLSYLNPANLVSDAFYTLYYYDTLSRYYLNLGLLFAFSIILFLVIYFVMRRQTYASL